jgi:hypothetical protein
MKMLVARLLPEGKRWELFIKGALQDPDYLKDGDRVQACARTGDGSIDLGQQHNRIVSRGIA